jgi:hypothetical protein
MTPVQAPPHPEQAREPEARRVPALTTAELSECTCPEFCERDHDLD